MGKPKSKLRKIEKLEKQALRLIQNPEEFAKVDAKIKTLQKSKTK